MSRLKQKHIISFGQHTDIGLRRSENQDFCGKFPPDNLEPGYGKGQLFIVADGMGGHMSGREASESAVTIIQKEYFADPASDPVASIKRAFEIANREIYTRSQSDAFGRKMGTTCTALILTPDQAIIAHVGDSRAYGANKGRIEQLTQDHSYVAQMQRNGILSTQEARGHPERSVLYRALGIESEVTVDIIKIPLRNWRFFILHTDGLAKISKEEILTSILANPPQQACKNLVQLANDRGGDDNSTVQVIKMDFEEKPVRPQKFQRSKRPVRKFFIGLAMLLSILIILFLMQNEIKQLISKVKPVLQPASADSTNCVFSSSNQQNIDSMLTAAQKASHTGDSDQALAIYQAILKIDPLQLVAIDEINKIIAGFKMRGDRSLARQDYSSALMLYQKAFVILPADEKLQNLILLCEQKLAAQQPAARSSTGPITTDSASQMALQPSDSSSAPVIADSVSGIHAADWSLHQLKQREYQTQEDGLIFSGNPGIKKVLYRNDLRDFQIEVLTRNFSPKVGGEYGIIIGYEMPESAAGESFFLYAVNETEQIFFKLMTDSVKILFSDSAKELFYQPRSLKLKIRCLGPYVMLYAENNLLKTVNLEKFIIGKVGLYCGANLKIQFSDLKITPLIAHGKN